MPEAFPQEIIRIKRDGGELPSEAIEEFARGLTDGSWSEGQVAAFAMAVFFRGMTMDERVTLTRAMTRSGEVLDWSSAGLSGPVVDKHSTGGVGDKVSLILAPVLAACGAVVPMISGRGLGHTGGTLDKLESIPGYRTSPDPVELGRVLKDVGCAIIGQTADLAPADRRFYAIRDVTSTVESIDLITASILSKKLAAGLDRLVMDIKFGSGAFADTYEMALELATSIVSVSNRASMPCSALLTDMNEVLGLSAGNAVEVLESIEFLRGDHREARLDEVTVALAAELLVQTGLRDDDASARTNIRSVLDSGAAAEAFGAMVKALGGPSDLLEHPERHLPLAPIERLVVPPREASVHAMNVRAIGLVVMGLGGGRHQAQDRVDHGVGVHDLVGLGARVGPNVPICRIRARSDDDAEIAQQRILSAITLGDEAPNPRPVIADRVGA